MLKNIRNLFAVITLVLLLNPLFSQKAYSNTQEAEGFVRNVASQALGIISNSGSRSESVNSLNILFENSFNIIWISKFILGKYYRQFTPEEFAEFQRLYKRYVLKKYIPRFKEFAGYQSKVTSSKSLGQNYYLVQTKVMDPTKANPISVEYRVKKSKSGKFYIHDISADGISLILTHRSEFTNYLHNNTVRSLMHKLENQSF